VKTSFKLVFSAICKSINLLMPPLVISGRR